MQGTERENAGCLPTILELLLNFIQFLCFPLVLKLSVSVMKILISKEYFPQNFCLRVVWGWEVDNLFFSLLEFW